jgi:hypothetical protein
MDQTGALSQLMSTIMDSDVAAARAATLVTLKVQGLPVVLLPNLSIMAAMAWAVFQAPPTLAKLTTTLAPPSGGSPAGEAEPDAPAATMLAAEPAPAAPPEPPRLLAQLRRYRAASAAAADRLVPGGRRPRRTGLASRLHAKAPAGSTFVHAYPLATAHAGEAGGLDLGLHEGGLAAVAVDPAGRSAIDWQGSLPVKALMFDEKDHLVEERLLGAGAAKDMPEGIAAIVLQGLPAAQSGEPAGWHSATILARAGFWTFLGDGFSVRPQAPPRHDLERRLRHRLTELSCGDLTALNRVGTRAGARPGWLDTIFPAGTTVVHIEIGCTGEHEDAAHAAVLAVGAEPAPEPAPAPAKVERIEGGVRLTYKLPAGAERLVVRTRDEEGATVRSVLGAAEEMNRADVAPAMFGVALGASRSAPPPAAAIRVWTANPATETGA